MGILATGKPAAECGGIPSGTVVNQNGAGVATEKGTSPARGDVLPHTILADYHVISAVSGINPGAVASRGGHGPVTENQVSADECGPDILKTYTATAFGAVISAHEVVGYHQN